MAKLFPCGVFKAATAAMLAGTAFATVNVSATGPARAELTVRGPGNCSAPAETLRLERPLTNTVRRLSGGGPVTVVAVGSSSTFGAGATSADRSYPSRLAVELKRLWGPIALQVVNAGVNGETAADMVARFDRTVLSARPDLVIWQVGSNAVLRNQPVADAAALVRHGVARLKAADTDVILMNPQYAPKVIAKPDGWRMVGVLEAAAKADRVAMFQRFAVMRHWFLDRHMPFASFLSPDGLHMNDWSYGCLAKLLAGSIADAAAWPGAVAGGAATARRP